jgi:Na+/melibiose symporter-like transporter
MIILAAVCFAVFFVDIHRFYAKWKLNFKPFNCASCLASWTALGLYFCPDIIQEIVLVMFASGVAAPIFKILMDILWNKATRTT